MKKYKLLREMPMNEVGEIWEDNGYGFWYPREDNILTAKYQKEAMALLTHNGWFEEVKEETVLIPKRKYVLGQTIFFADGCVCRGFYEHRECDKNRMNIGLVYGTKELAQAELKRMESRAKRHDFLPKDGEKYFYYRGEGDTAPVYWGNDFSDYESWHTGNCHRTVDDSEKWGEEYAIFFLPPHQK